METRENDELLALRPLRLGGSTARVTVTADTSAFQGRRRVPFATPVLAASPYPKRTAASKDGNFLVCILVLGVVLLAALAVLVARPDLLSAKGTTGDRALRWRRSAHDDSVAAAVAAVAAAASAAAALLAAPRVAPTVADAATQRTTARRAAARTLCRRLVLVRLRTADVCDRRVHFVAAAVPRRRDAYGGVLQVQRPRAAPLHATTAVATAALGSTYPVLSAGTTVRTRTRTRTRTRIDTQIRFSSTQKSTPDTVAAARAVRLRVRRLLGQRLAGASQSLLPEGAVVQGRRPPRQPTRARPRVPDHRSPHGGARTGRRVGARDGPRRAGHAPRPAVRRHCGRGQRRHCGRGQRRHCWTQSVRVYSQFATPAASLATAAIGATRVALATATATLASTADGAAATSATSRPAKRATMSRRVQRLCPLWRWLVDDLLRRRRRVRRRRPRGGV